MTIKIIGSPGAVKWYIYGQVAQVKIGGVTQTYGTTWQYINGNTATRINIGSSTDVFISFSSGSLSVRNLYLTGAIFGATAQFNQPTIFINSPSLSNVTEIGLYDASGLLYDHIFTTPVSITSGSNVTIPYKFNDTNTGLVTYQLAAVVQSHSNYTIVFSNNLELYFGSFTPGKLTLNYTNPLSVSFRFVKNDINSTATNLDVYYPSTFNSTCSMLYQQEQTNKTYSGLPASHATFTFLGLGNDSVQVDCKDTITNATGTYVLTQSNFPLLQQIKDFRDGKFGTSGKFGAFDLVSLIALIVSILGFNRVNESVGAIFNIFLIGFLAYFGIIAWPVILSSSVALVLVLVISSTRKTQFG